MKNIIRKANNLPAASKVRKVFSINRDKIVATDFLQLDQITGIMRVYMNIYAVGLGIYEF